VLHDLRLSVRLLARHPLFTLAAVVSLALGIGANTVVYSVVRSVLLHPLPVHDPARLVVVSEAAAAALGASYVPARKAARTDPALVLRQAGE
jgi:ABC-type lipoprotein release transport system permease subunit